MLLSSTISSLFVSCVEKIVYGFTKVCTLLICFLTVYIGVIFTALLKLSRFANIWMQANLTFLGSAFV